MMWHEMWPLVIIWSGIGLLGWLIMAVKNSNRPLKAIGFGLFTLPHAVIFGPLFFFLSLTVPSTQICPYCQSDIPTAAIVCQKCTRDLPGKSGK